MKEGLKLALNALFDDYEARKKKRQEEYESEKQEEDKFLKEFFLIREQVIKLAMQEIGELLKERGQEFRIVEENESVDPSGKLKEARISMFFLVPEPKQGYELKQYPSATFLAAKSKKTVRVHERTMGPGRGGHSGSAGEYTLDQIRVDLVQEKIAEILRQTFGE